MPPPPAEIPNADPTVDVFVEQGNDGQANTERKPKNENLAKPKIFFLIVTTR